MVKININDKTYKIPERLTIEQYHSLLQFDWQDPKFYPLIVSQLIKAPLPLLAKAPKKSLELAVSFVISSMNKRVKCEMMDLESMTFGEFVDLDVYLSEGLDKRFKDIVAMLTGAQWADEAMYAIEEFAKYRLYIFRQYKVLFGLRDEDLKQAEDEPHNPDKLHVARSWYKVIVSLAGDNILNLDKVTEQPLKKTLNFMALQKEKALEEKQKQLEQKRKYDLQRNR
jgi:hypothetical protein